MEKNVLVTNNNTTPGTSFYLSKNVIQVGLGNKLLIDAGIINSIVLGGWNRLMACCSTIIYLGTKNKITLANSLEVYNGDRHVVYDGANVITQDEVSIKGVWNLLLNGGVSEEEMNSRLWDNEQSGRIGFAAIVSFLATVAISLIGLNYPATRVNTTDPVNSAAADQNTALIAISDTLGILGLFFAQFLLAKKMKDRLDGFNAVTNLSLGANGLTSAVFSDPERQPILLNDASGYDWFEDGSSAPVRVNKDKKAKQLGVLVGENLLHETPGSSPAAIFNMLPGMPLEENEYHDWKNIKTGKYPVHDSFPFITLRSQLELHKEIYAGMDIDSSSVLLTANHGFNFSKTEEQVKSTQFQHASIILESGVQPLNNEGVYTPVELDKKVTKQSVVILTAKDKDDNGSDVRISSKNIEFYQNGSDQHFYIAVVNKDNILEFDETEPFGEKHNGNFEEETLPHDKESKEIFEIIELEDSDKVELGKYDQEKENLKGSLSELFIDDSRIMLATASGKNGFFADSKGTYICFNNNKVLSIDNKGVTLCNDEIEFNNKMVKLGDFNVKISTLNPKSNKLKEREDIIADNINFHTKCVKERLLLMKSRIKNTGGFSDSVFKDNMKYPLKFKSNFPKSYWRRVWNSIVNTVHPLPKRPDGSRKLWF